MAIPISFGAYNFSSKSSAINEIQNRLNSYNSGDSLNEDDHFFFLSLFKLHDEFYEKKGVGIDKFVVNLGLKNNRYINIHRTDGSIIDISWRHCLSPMRDKTVISLAFRRSVSDLVIQFKSTALKSDDCTCPISNERLTKNNSEVTYYLKSFEQHLHEFLLEKDIKITVADLIDSEDSNRDPRSILRDQKLSLDWQDYIINNATLRLTHINYRSQAS